MRFVKKDSQSRILYEKSRKEGMAIWYMCYCPEQDPTELAELCKARISKEALQEAFVPTYDKMKRYQGEWHIEQGIVFPGYIFLESANSDVLFSELKRCSRDEQSLQEILEQKMFCLQPEQERFLNSVLGKEKHLEFSKGYIKDGCTCVTQGPLQGKESMICKIDRHKRLAKLQIPLGSNRGDMYAGLEIISKS